LLHDSELLFKEIYRLQRENEEYKRKFEDGEFVSKEWHDEQVEHAELVMKEQQAEIERLTERAERAAICEDEYLEWATGFLKTRFDIKDWFTNPEHQRTPCTYEFFASTLWKKIKSAMSWLDELEEREETLTEENTELQKQVYELKLELQGQFDKGVKAGCLMSKVKEQQAVKDTAKEIFTELLKDENVKINVRLDQWGEPYNVACVNFDTIEELAKERYGVEVE
jgi:hypothetical protein